jgi:hypothetical protein
VVGVGYVANDGGERQRVVFRSETSQLFLVSGVDSDLWVVGVMGKKVIN